MVNRKKDGKPFRVTYHIEFSTKVYAPSKATAIETADVDFSRACLNPRIVVKAL